MITSFQQAEGAKKFPCKWWPEVDTLGTRKFEFANGINFIVGPNGSGKSTLTKTIARLFMAEQGGRQTITQTSTMDMFDIFDKNNPFDSFVVDHDGGPVFYMNPEDSVGMMGGGFDDDFFKEGFLNTTSKVSSGQKSIRGMNRILNLIQEWADGAPNVDDRLGGKCNDLYQGRVDLAMEFMKPSRDGRPLIILDEPDSSVDMLGEIELFNLLRDASANCQIIVNTHSQLALDMEANVIETVDGYVRKCNRAKRMRGKR